MIDAFRFFFKVLHGGQNRALPKLSTTVVVDIGPPGRKAHINLVHGDLQNGSTRRYWNYLEDYWPWAGQNRAYSVDPSFKALPLTRHSCAKKKKRMKVHQEGHTHGAEHKQHTGRFSLVEPDVTRSFPIRKNTYYVILCPLMSKKHTVRLYVLSACPLHTYSGCGKERRILIGPW